MQRRQRLKTKSGQYDEVELALNEHLSRKVTVKNAKDGTSGTLEIEFYSEEDLAELAKLFDK